MAEHRAARSVAFVLTLVGMLVAACLLVGIGFTFAFGETPEPPSAAATPSWAKYVCWALAALTAVAAIPAGRIAARVVGGRSE